MLLKFRYKTNYTLKMGKCLLIGHFFNIEHSEKFWEAYRKEKIFILFWSITENTILNFKSITRNCKTQCQFFFYDIKAIQEKFKNPFVDFTEIVGDSVIYISTLEFMHVNFPNKSVIALFTSHFLVKVLACAKKLKFQSYRIFLIHLGWYSWKKYR